MFGSKQTEAMRYKLANQSVGAGGAEGGGGTESPMIICGALLVLREALTPSTTQEVFCEIKWLT